MSLEIHVNVIGGGDQLPDGPDPAEDPAGDPGGEVEEDRHEGFHIFQDVDSPEDLGSVGNAPSAISNNDSGEIQAANRAVGASDEAENVSNSNTQSEEGGSSKDDEKKKKRKSTKRNWGRSTPVSGVGLSCASLPGNRT